ncbi:hypothetical protein FBU31_002669 [Coemansia sp. 'formosensis']|nr:hypothetical protein FBU31_002669 [Coemansia sp. 'formosensis']
MAQFFIPMVAAHYHPAIRQQQQDVALDLSLKKLSDMKSAQRATHRSPSLLKTVLVYNMFKAAIITPVDDAHMDVDEPSTEESGAAAEQSWFDRCIDNMLEDSQEPSSTFCMDDDDDDDDEEECVLKRSPSVPALAILGTTADCRGPITAAASSSPRVAAAEDMTPGAWQKDGLWPTRDPQTLQLFSQ